MALNKSDKNRVIVVQGAQWGGEGKGMVAAALVEQKNIDICVRTGAVNAGHTVIYRDKPYRMQQLPVGWVRPETTLVIGAGAFIHPDILQNEVQMVAEAMHVSTFDVWGRIIIDYRCGLHLPVHTERATTADRHTKMGATGKGCSEAVIDKISQRGNGYLSFKDFMGPNENPKVLFMDTAEYLNAAFDSGNSILIEGTQGTLLDLHLGPYPYTTHKQTQAANWLAECGLSSRIPHEICLVARTYPIRGAGNSGPMPRETYWPTLTRRINERLIARGMKPRVDSLALSTYSAAYAHLCDNQSTAYPSQNLFLSNAASDAFKQMLPQVQAELARVFEFTTVTKKLCRVAEWDMDTMRESVMLNRPDYMVLTFLNYWYPELWNITSRHDVSPEAMGKTLALSRELGVPIPYVTTGAESKQFLQIGSIIR